MAIARSKLVRDDLEGTYHCVSRCVRRAFLCGVDSVSGKNFEHRRQWLYLRLVELSRTFMIDVCGYAIMENHFHVILRNRPDLVAESSDDAIARCWLRLFPKRRTPYGQPEEPNDLEVSLLLETPGRVAVLRQQLSSISWFMRCLKENLARRANAEDKVTGRFWEGRFKCTALLDQSAILACTAYVDLNPIRAGMAETPENSTYTSARERILERQAAAPLKTVTKSEQASTNPKETTPILVSGQKTESWLCPLRNKPNRKGFLNIDLDDYLELLDWTGRQIVEGKSGSIPPHLAPILKRLDLDDHQWLESSQHFASHFYRAAGKAATMTQVAADTGQCWLKGTQAGRTLFLAA